MADELNRETSRKLIVRGLGWCLCLSLWTVALLTIFPVELGSAIMPEEMHFPAAKCLHVCAYAFLTMYLAWMPLRSWRWLFLAFLSLHAAGTEYFQRFVPGRHGTVSDFFIDHLGIALGIGLTWKYWLPWFTNASQPHRSGYTTLLRSVANPRQVTSSPLLSSPPSPDAAGEASIK
jgi:VanZ family protein